MVAVTSSNIVRLSASVSWQHACSARALTFAPPHWRGDQGPWRFKARRTGPAEKSPAWSGRSTNQYNLEFVPSRTASPEMQQGRMGSRFYLGKGLTRNSSEEVPDSFTLAPSSPSQPFAKEIEKS
jgi:hypothetical protein